MVKSSEGVIDASAPGKIIWLGGYSVLERPNLGFVTTVDARVHARIRITAGNEIRLISPQFGADFSGMVDAKTGKFTIDVSKELALVKACAEIATRYAVSIGHKAQSMTIETVSGDAFAIRDPGTNKSQKSGLGSSAAVTVATVGGVLAAYGIDTNENDALHKLAQLSHSLTTSKVGSGFDIAAATNGSIVYRRYSPTIISGFTQDLTNADLQNVVKRAWDYQIEKMRMPSMLLPVFANFVGHSMVTSVSVSKVLELKKNDPEHYHKLIAGISEQDKIAVSALKELEKEIEHAHNLALFRESFENGRLLTKKLGELSGSEIEPDDATQLIEETKKNGALVSKLPGSGGKDAIASLCTKPRNVEMLRNFLSKNKELHLINISLKNDGFTVEKKVS